MDKLFFFFVGMQKINVFRIRLIMKSCLNYFFFSVGMYKINYEKLLLGHKTGP